MKKCFRIENEDGVGPFQSFVSDKFDLLSKRAYDDGKHPLPKFAIAFMDVDEIFAFKKISTIREWFNKDMLEELYYNGYFISEYKLGAYSRADAIQVTFLKNYATLVNTHSLQELNHG